MVVAKIILLGLIFIAPVRAFAGQRNPSLMVNGVSVPPTAIRVAGSPALASADPMSSLFKTKFVQKVAGFLTSPQRPSRLTSGSYSVYANFSF